MNFKPLVIIGAPRSGTNMLRDVLCTLPGVATWPCDEINYIWRHGNVRHPSDEFSPEMARPAIGRYIRRQFDWVARRYYARLVVEKTCANSLRVPFVDAVVPEARYLFIYRDGLDAVGSAMKRWQAPLDIPYLARKARFVPLTDLPYYAGHYFWNRLYRLFSKEERLAFWGPRMADMPRLLANHPLDEICALQWQHCMKAAAAAFAAMPEERWLGLSYEAFVRNPVDELTRILDFLSLDVPPEACRQAVAGVRAGSIGKGRTALDHGTQVRLATLVQSTLEHYGYSIPS